MTPQQVFLEIVGTPAPQGSKTRMPNGAIVEGRSTGQRMRHTLWRQAVADAAKTAAETHGQFTGGIELVVTFRFPMPKSRPKAVRAAGLANKITQPDLDKLLRTVGDGLVTGGLIADDALIVAITAAKTETTQWTGCRLLVRSIDDSRLTTWLV